MNKLIATVLLVSGLAVLPGLALAQPGVSHGGPPGLDKLDHLDMLADQIGLSEEQGSQIVEIVNAGQLATAVDRERMQQIRDELHAMADNFDPSQAQILADEMGEISSRLAYTRAENQAAVREVFTDEQKTLLDELRAEHESHRGSRFGDGERPRGGEE
jgi:protein CpxP